MRRSSVITIILLVLVIIGLSVALVVTNLPKKEVDETLETTVENVQEETKQEEKAKEVSLDSEIAIDMAKITNPLTSAFHPYFYSFSTSVLNEKNLTDVEKMEIAYYYEIADKVVTEQLQAPEGYTYERRKFSKEDMDNAIMKIFNVKANVEQDLILAYTRYDYNAEDKMYYALTGGGGGPRPNAIAGIYKVLEYEDRYEAYAKCIFTVPYTEPDSLRISIKNVDSYFYYEIGHYMAGEDAIEKYTAGVEDKKFIHVSTEKYINDQYKLLSKFYDQAGEYKHTFMKNSDGTYYWAKSELIK